MTKTPRRVHWFSGGKTTRCGRDPKHFLWNAREEKVTCQQCLVPNRGFTGGYYRTPR